jgi:CRISPR-associated protein Cmr6
MEYRAQLQNRCTRQFAKCGDAETWVHEWLAAASSHSPFFIGSLRVFKVSVDWRLITNSGIDADFIRPVIAAGGWPVIPGSSIKGLFRRAFCNASPDEKRSGRHKVERWCGSQSTNSAEYSDADRQGILRFHGAWPANDSWRRRLLDVAHPQEAWQLWRNPDHNGKIHHNANAVISLFQPELCIALSSSDPTITNEEWQDVMLTLRRSLELGLGGRTCATYGSSRTLTKNVIFECGLEGQGSLSTLLSSRTPEFRPNLFRASIRSMAMRLFGGLCGDNHAQNIVGELFGSIVTIGGGRSGPTRGLVDFVYTDCTFDAGVGGTGRMEGPVFAASGLLQWRLNTSSLSPTKKEVLVNLLRSLHALTFTLGGFGRGWRRPDHRIFMPNYFLGPDPKPPIGCHWQWRDSVLISNYPGLAVQSVDDLQSLLQSARQHAREWIGTSLPTQVASWREVIHPDFMNVWVRDTKSQLDAKAIHWFHQALPDGVREGYRDPRMLKNTYLSGRIEADRRNNLRMLLQVGQVWNRMLPKLNAKTLNDWQNSNRTGVQVGQARIVPWQAGYLEVFVVFKDRHGTSNIRGYEPRHTEALMHCINDEETEFRPVRF